jgi:integrase/recombinase XerC
MATPARRGELAGLSVEDTIVYPKQGYGTMTVLGKGNRWRTMPFGAKTAAAVRKYINRARKSHALADASDALWLGYRGP